MPREIDQISIECTGSTTGGHARTRGNERGKSINSPSIYPRDRACPPWFVLPYMQLQTVLGREDVNSWPAAPVDAAFRRARSFLTHSLSHLQTIYLQGGTIATATATFQTS